MTRLGASVRMTGNAVAGGDFLVKRLIGRAARHCSWVLRMETASKQRLYVRAAPHKRPLAARCILRRGPHKCRFTQPVADSDPALWAPRHRRGAFTPQLQNIDR